MMTRIRFNTSDTDSLEKFFERREDVLSHHLWSSDCGITAYIHTVDGLEPQTYTLMLLKYTVESIE